jgi:hypothetical protein
MVKYLNPKEAKKYSLSGVSNTYYLGFRDVPALIEKYVQGKRAVDYVCGSGRSTRFIRDLGFETIDIDVSKEMLKQAV